MKKRIIALLLAFCFIAAVPVLAACNGAAGGDGRITLTVWEDETNIEMLKAVATQFEADYVRAYPSAPRVKVEFEVQPEASAMENLGQYGPVGMGPDVLAFVHDTVGTGVNSGDLAKAEYAAALRETMTEQAVNAFTIEGEVYGYPITAESITLMYDKSKVSAEDLVSFETIKAKGLKIAMKVTDEGSAYYSFAFMTDSVLFGADGFDAKTVQLDTSDSVANLTAFYSQYKGNIMDIMPQEAVDMLKNGQIHAIMSSPFLWSAVKEKLGSNAAVAVLPTIGGNTLRPFSGYKGYGVSAYSKNPHLAHALALYLSSPAAQLKRFIDKQYLPTVNDLSAFEERMANETGDKYQYVSVFSQSLSSSISMPAILAMGNFWNPMQDAHTAMFNRSSIDAAFVTSQLNAAETAILK